MFETGCRVWDIKMFRYGDKIWVVDTLRGEIRRGMITKVNGTPFAPFSVLLTTGTFNKVFSINSIIGRDDV